MIYPLSPREKEVLCLSPHTVGEIARYLGIKEKTVSKHHHIINIKLGCPPRATNLQRTIRALELGIITLQDLEVGSYRHDEGEGSY